MRCKACGNRHFFKAIITSTSTGTVWYDDEGNVSSYDEDCTETEFSDHECGECGSDDIDEGEEE